MRRKCITKSLTSYWLHRFEMYSKMLDDSRGLFAPGAAPPLGTRFVAILRHKFFCTNG